MIPRHLFRVIVALFLAAIGSAHGQVINPADYGNITLRLSADTLAFANNAAVTAWGPLTAGGTATPLFIASDARFNNKPVVKFDGSNDLMTWPLPNLNARTIFAVVTQESAAGAGNSIATLLGDSNDNLGFRRNATLSSYNAPGNTNDFSGVAPAGTLTVNNSGTSNFTPGTPHIVVAVGGGLRNFATAFWIGNAKSTLARFWNGSVAEIIVYDGVLTADGMNKVGYYLQNKYNIAGSTYTAPSSVVNSFTVAAGGITAKTGVLSPAGAPVTLAWNVGNVTTVSIDHGALASPGTTTGSVAVSPTTTTTYTLTASNTFGSITRAVTVYVGLTAQSLVLNEFLADNGSSVPDEDGTKQDWIEIYNPNPFAVSAGGWQLVDGASTWTFPSAAMEGAAYTLVFASGKNRTNPAAPLHTSFSLGKGGDYLALKRPDNSIATEFSPKYPVQRTDISYGLSSGSASYFSIPTPGAPNSAGTLSAFVEDTSFSVKRGFYSTPQTVAISCATSGATIRYTLDNTTPTETNGAVYTTPLTISTTTTVRVRAFKSGLVSSNTDTQTYVFVSDVPAQVYATAPAGWPIPGAAQLNGQTMRYGFQTALKSQYTTQQLTDALNQVPSLSIVTDQGNLTDQATGIYSNADQKGDAWERAASVEYLPPGNVTGFHINCGLRIRGGASRGDYAPKHSFRLYFRSQYGDGTLKFPLHGTAGTDEFQTIDIRSEENYSWANDVSSPQNENTQVREVFCRDLEGALGQPQTRSRYLHVFLNGQYWGLYMTEERAQEDYGATYFGGTSDDYDVVQTSNHPNFTYELASGTPDAWQQTWNLARACAANPTNANYFALLGRDANGVRVPAMPVYIDPAHLATYMLLHYYTGDGDGPLSNFLVFNRANNWRGFRNRLTETGWRFFPHDCEHTLLAPSWVDGRATANTTGGSNRSNFTYSNSEWIHEDLATNAEFKLKIADMAQKHLFNNGALTPAKAQALFDTRAAQINQAIIADCVRWGTSTTLHTYAQWQARLDNIRTTFFPVRTSTVIGHLQSRGFYPTATPPAFSQRGGQVSPGYSLTLSAGAQAGTSYYTLDGSDPRAVGGAVAGAAYASGIAINVPTLVRTRFRSSGGIWSAIDEATFSIYPPAAAGNLVVSKLHYHPPGPSSAESIAGYTSSDFFEYIELQNIGTQTLDLTGVSLSDAVTFSFAGAAITTLAPGARVLVVANTGAFAMRYGSGLPVAGAFVGSFNNAGELVRVLGAGGPIAQFTYDDAGAWPVAADGSGAALVLLNPATNPNPNLGGSWRGSYVPGGRPGVADEWTVAVWRALKFTAADLADSAKEATVWGNNADPDGDGVSNFTEFLMGSSPTDSTSRPVQTSSVYTDPGTSLTYLQITCSLREGLSGVTATAQGSGDLANWSAGPALVASVSQGNGTLLALWRDNTAMNAAPGNRRFLRLQIIAQP